MSKRQREKENAWKIIKENEIEKEKREKMKDAEKEYAVKLMEENEKRAEETAKKR